MCLPCSYKKSCTCTLPAGTSCSPAPDAPANGQRSGSGTTFESTVTYTCNPGYTLQGDNRRTCMASGEWSGKTPTCNRKLLAIRCSTIDIHGHQKSIKAMILQVEWQYTCSAWLRINYTQCVQSTVTYNLTYIGPLWLVVMCTQIHVCTCTMPTMVSMMHVYTKCICV